MHTAQYEHTFEWTGEANSVVWSSSLHLTRNLSGIFRVRKRFEFGTKLAYKFIVDGQWCTSPEAPSEWDASGNLNNVLQVPPLSIPRLNPEHIQALDEQSRDVEAFRTIRLARWTGEKVELVAALQPSAPLTCNVLRASLLPTLAEIYSPYRFVKLISSACSIEQQLKPEVFSEADGEEAVEEGTYLLVGAESVISLSLKSLPRTLAPPPQPINLPKPSPSLLTPGPPSPSFAAPNLGLSLTPPKSTPSARLPRSATRYFDFPGFSSSSSESWASDLDVSGSGEGEGDVTYAPSYASSDFSDVAPGVRSRSASFAAEGDDEAAATGDEDDDPEADARSDATFNTALSGWISSVGTGAGTEGWSSGGAGLLSASESESAASGTGDELRTPVGRGMGFDQASVGDDDEEEEPRPFEIKKGVEGEVNKAVEQAWAEGAFVLVPFKATYLPLALHPSALPLVSSITPSPLLDSSSMTKHDTATSATQQLPTPPASPPKRMDLDLPCLPGIAPSSDGLDDASGKKLVQEAAAQLERAVGKWVGV
ncbi:hypothetical protein JCM10207_005611 [Rhodosporidiobolus poonsookiae]